MGSANITLIGMAGAGKSTVGSALATSLGWRFIDIDTLIEEEQGKTIQDILDEIGDGKFVELEAPVLPKITSVQNTIIAPRGV